jgi:hypothetical protein
MNPRTSEHERRGKRRFAIERDLRYKTADHGVPVAAGSGQTMNMGSGGVAFVAEQPLTPGRFVELSIGWPILLGGTCPIRFVVFGRILRCNGRKAVCTIEKYEFRTQARTFQPPALTRADAMLLRWVDEVHREDLRTHVAGA